MAKAVATSSDDISEPHSIDNVPHPINTDLSWVRTTFVCVIWIGTFGGTAISQVVADATAPVKVAALELKLFYILEALAC